MPNVMDYLEWRGDLTFTEAPLNEVDNLILCMLSYVTLDSILPSTSSGIPLRAAAAEYFLAHPVQTDRPLGFILPADILTLFKRMAHTRRFRDLILTNYTSELSEERETQFAALTLRIPEEGMFVAFRGTDDTLVGWKEDFNLFCMNEIPSQRRATVYLNELDVPPDTTLYVGGHSKGGNLAVWSAVHAEERIRRVIRRVYSNDGPGFSEGTVDSEAYKTLSDRIRVLLPEDSLVGLLLDRDPHYTVIKSSRRGLAQHDGLSWEVLGGQFIRADGLSATGIRNDTVIRERIDSMTSEERLDFIRLMFTLLESTGAKTLTELHQGRFKTVLTALKAFRDMSEKDQETASYLWDKLVGTRNSEAPPIHRPPRRDPRSSAPKGRIRVSLFPLLLP